MIANAISKCCRPFRLTAVLFAVYLVIYVSICMRFGRHWDEVLDYDGGAYDTYIAAGRWVTGSWRYLCGNWMPCCIPGVLAGLVLACLVPVQARQLGIQGNWRLLAYGVLYFVSVQWAHMLKYSFLSESVAIGMACATGAAVLCGRKGWRNMAGSWLLLTIALGCYQTLALYFAVFWLLLRTGRILRQEECPLREWLRLAGVSMAAVMAWAAVKSAMSAHLSKETLDYVLQYQASSNQWGAFISTLDNHDRILCVVYYFKETVCRALGMGKESYPLFAASAIPLLLLLRRLWRSVHGWLRVEGMISVLVVWWLPFCMTLLMLRPMDFRTALAAPLSFAGLWLLATAGWKPQPRTTKLLLPVTGFLLVATAAGTVFMDAQEEYRLHQGCINFLNQVEHRASTCAQQAGLSKPQIMVLGNRRDKDEAFAGAYPIFTAIVMHWYTKAYGFNNIRRGDMEDMSRHAAMYATMPCWPEEGSVAADGGEIIIRIGDDK